MNRYFELSKIGMVLLLLSVTAPAVPAANSATPVSFVTDTAPLSDVPEFYLPEVDHQKFIDEDRANTGKDIPFRYAALQPVNLDLMRDGLYEELPNGDHLWRIRITSKNAYTLSFQFRPFKLPEGAHLYIYSVYEDYVVGPVTERNDRGRNELWTPAVPHDRAVIELYLPFDHDFEPKAGIGSAVHAYRDTLLQMISPPLTEPSPGSSGSCNVDVECERSQWGDEINSVAHYTYGLYMCTGTLINNVSQDCTPYFWTANHCVSRDSDAGKVTTYWNYERSGCGSGTGPTNNTVGNSSLIWTYSGSDATLLQLDSFPPDAYVPYLTGFDAGGSAASKSTCIHHPSGDYKKISHENDAITVTSYLGDSSPGDGTHWRVGDWDSGTTEGGSSGSGLWNDSSRRLIGQLHGGYAACGNNDPDWYGRFSVSWANGADTYLDPGNTGQNYVDGLDYTSCGTCNPPNAPSGLTVTDNCGSVSLSWTGVTADGYNIYREDTGTCGGSYTQIDSGVTGTTYIDSTVTIGNTYAYMIRAYSGDFTCESSDSNCVTATVDDVPSAPAAPTVTDDCSGLLVSWTAASYADTYNVYRRGGGCGNNGWSQVHTGETGTSWLDTGVTVGNAYGYYIESVNTCGTATDGNNACGEATHSLTEPVVDVTPDGTTTVCGGEDIIFTCGVTGGSGSYTYQWTRDGGNINGETNATLTENFASAQSHVYNCEVVDTAGCTGTFTDTSNSTGEWTATPFTNPANDGPVCDGKGIRFHAYAGGGTTPYTYSWDFGDGSGTDNTANPKYTYAAPGTYSACVTVTDANGCVSVLNCTSAVVYDTPLAAPANDGPVCNAIPVSFTANASGGTSPYTYGWDFGDGSGTSNQADPAYTYVAPGTYNACVQVTTDDGCGSAIECTPVTVWANPSAAPTNDGPSCGAINFTADEAGGTAPYTYAWDFGDGVGTSTAANPTYTYGSAGTYNACVTVTDANGCTSGAQCTSAQKTDAPTAMPSNDGPICLGGSMNFNSNASGGTSPYIYAWDFGDGLGTSTAADPSYTYASSGTFNACVTVTDSLGCSSGAECATAMVYENPTAAPTNDGPACLGNAINFTANAAGGSGTYTYTWDFGDGLGTSAAENPTYTYGGAGTYNATVIVSDANGCTSGAQGTTATVYDNPAASPANDGPTVPGNPTSFTSNASGGTTPYAYSWDFGDGVGTSTSANPSYTYGSAGTYNACVTVTDANGCTSGAQCTGVTVESGNVGEVPVTAGASKSGSDVSFSHDAAVNGDSYNLYRGSLDTLHSGYNHDFRANTIDDCMGDGTGDMILDDTGVLDDGNNYYYLIGANDGYCEGSLGINSNNTDRPHSPDMCTGLVICP